jgi:hypothetical protein
MKEIKLLDRVQADKLLFIKLILATIQESHLKSELTFHNFRHISLQRDFSRVKSEIDRFLSCKSSNFL